jgi:hypothetical protein
MVYSVPLGYRSQSGDLGPARMPWRASIGERQGHLIRRDIGVMASVAFRQDAGSTQHSRPTGRGSGWMAWTGVTWGDTAATIPGESRCDGTRAPAGLWRPAWCGLVGGMGRTWWDPRLLCARVPGSCGVPGSPVSQERHRNDGGSH